MLTQNIGIELRRECISDIKKTAVAFVNTSGVIIAVGIIPKKGKEEQGIGIYPMPLAIIADFYPNAINTVS